MDEKSVWKKEISFRRKARNAKVEATDDAPKSVWKKDISFKRRPREPKPVVAAEITPAAEPKQSIWRRELTLGRKKEPRPDEPREAVEAVAASEAAAPVQPVEPVQPVAVDEVAVPEPAPVLPAEPEPSAVELIERIIAKPVHDAIQQTAIPPAEAQPSPPPPTPAPEPAAPSFELPSQQSVANPERGIEPVAEPSGAEEQTVELLLPDVEPAIPTEPPPAAAMQTEVVHAPIPAAELPPLATERDGAKPTPVWRREVVLGRRKAAKPKDETPAGAVPETEKPKKRKAVKVPRLPKAPKLPKLSVDRGGKGKKIVGLKIGASQLAAARVTNNGAAELLQVAREPLSPGIVVGGELRDPDALAIALKDFFGKHKLPKRGVRLGIANNRIGVRTFEIGGITDAKQLDNAVRFRAQEALPIPIDEAVMDYQLLGESTDEEGQPVKRVLLVVAYREQIDRYVDACKKAGVTLLGIDLEAFAMLRALQAPQPAIDQEPEAALVAVAVGHERSTFAVSDGRVCEFTRVLEWGGQALSVAIARALDAAPSEVEAVKRALSLHDESVPEGLTSEQAAKARDAVRRAIQNFARELVSSLQFYQNQPGSLGIGEIVLTGGTAHLPGIATELEQLIGVHVRIGDPLARIKLSKRVREPEQLGSYSVAIGLGIED
jgi:type IV pilus assembly protein PilM